MDPTVAATQHLLQLLVVDHEPCMVLLRTVIFVLSSSIVMSMVLDYAGIFIFSEFPLFGGIVTDCVQSLPTTCLHCKLPFFHICCQVSWLHIVLCVTPSWHQAFTFVFAREVSQLTIRATPPLALFLSFHIS